MRSRRRMISAASVVFAAHFLVGCDAQKSDRERIRLQAEEQARREAEASNKAITDFNQRVFGRKPATPPSEPPKSDAPVALPPGA